MIPEQTAELLKRLYIATTFEECNAIYEEAEDGSLVKIIAVRKMLKTAITFDHFSIVHLKPEFNSSITNSDFKETINNRMKELTKSNYVLGNGVNCMTELLRGYESGDQLEEETLREIFILVGNNIPQLKNLLKLAGTHTMFYEDVFDKILRLEKTN